MRSTPVLPEHFLEDRILFDTGGKHGAETQEGLLAIARVNE
jgi:hypothetical protein